MNIDIDIQVGDIRQALYNLHPKVLPGDHIEVIAHAPKYGNHYWLVKSVEHGIEIKCPDEYIAHLIKRAEYEVCK